MNEYIIIRYINSFNFMLFLFMLNSILISYFLSLLLFYPEVLVKLSKLNRAILFFDSNFKFIFHLHFMSK